MNPFYAVRDALGLTFESGTSQNLHWHYLLLTALGDAEAANPTANTFSNPAKEVLHRLRSYEGFAVQEIRRLLAARAE
jgi:hypothetical protein